MIKQNVTIKIRKGTLEKLRILHALLDESMVSILDRLVTAALEKARVQEYLDIRYEPILASITAEMWDEAMGKRRAMADLSDSPTR